MCRSSLTIPGSGEHVEIAQKKKGKIGSRRARKPLAGALKDKDPAVRYAAKDALALITKQIDPPE